MFLQLPPEKIKEIVMEIEGPFTAYYDIKTGEILSVPDGHDGYFDLKDDPWADIVERFEENPDDFVVFKKPESHESFKAMEAFIRTLKGESLKTTLQNALSQRKPFRNFRDALSGQALEHWYAFQKQWLAEYVQRIIDEFNEEHKPNIEEEGVE